jgi:hypothetical protein
MSAFKTAVNLLFLLSYKNKQHEKEQKKSKRETNMWVTAVGNVEDFHHLPAAVQ